MNRGREKFNKYKKVIFFISGLFAILPLRIRIKLLEQFRMVKGVKGLVTRYILLKSIARKCGDNVSIHPSVYLLNPQNLSIGNNVSIHPMCYIECGAKGTVIIGNDVSIAHGTTIMASSHVYSNIDIPIKDQPVEFKSVEICDNVWIGAKATILYGRTIRSGSIVGAHALVVNDVLENTIVGGIPAKVIKERTE